MMRLASLDTEIAPRDYPLTPRPQRFCPLCDRSFVDGEAVLRCEGCGVMHHPACWVKKGGCATSTDHKSVPTALAYADKAVPGASPHPGEGTRVTRRPDPASSDPSPPVQIQSRQAARATAAPAPTSHSELPGEGVVIGASPSAPPPRSVPPPEPVGMVAGPRKPPVTSRAYKVDRSGKPMPSLYGRHRLLQYWYVPAAVLVAVGVAFAVIWVAGLFGDDDPDAAGSETPGTTTLPTPSAAATGAGAGATQPPGSATPGQTPAPTGGKFQINDPVVVTGVGSGAPGEPACLNVRTEPGTDKTIIDCVRDGTQLTVLGGPQEAGGLTWWRLKLSSGDGWAAEDYLAKR